MLDNNTTGTQAPEGQPSNDGSFGNLMTQQSPMTQRASSEPEPTQQPVQQPAQQPAQQQPAVEPIADPAETEMPVTVQDMIGDELMKDPSTRIAVQQVQLLCGNDIDVQRAFGAAYLHEDASRVDIAYLTEKVGAVKAQQILEAVDFVVGSAQRTAERINQELYASIEGGEQALRQGVAIFNGTASLQDRTMVKDLLDSGNLSYMRYAANIIMQQANQAGGQYKHNAMPAMAQTPMQPMSRDDYLKAISNPNITSEEYEQVRQRYAMSRQ